MTEGFNVGVVGCGYVGLTTGACLAHIGHRVTCVDNNARLVTELGEGRIPFYEPGLAELVGEGVHHGRLRFSTNLAPVACGADVIFIAVGTPQGEGGSVDLSSVAAVARGIGRALAEPETNRERSRERPLVVVTKSTVPVGSGDYVSMLIRDGLEETGRKGAHFLVASNPEFLREGSAIYDSLFPDRIVVGSSPGRP
jgi:UDPglucose 6-dehydrogenase